MATKRAADELAALRDAIGKTTVSFQLAALAEAYAAVATKVKEGDLRAADELAALRDVIGKTTDDQPAALAQAYAAVAKAVQRAIVPERDIAVHGRDRAPRGRPPPRRRRAESASMSAPPTCPVTPVRRNAS